PGVLRQLEDRIDREASITVAASLKIVTFTLLGLRFPPDLAEQLMPRIRNMRDSSTYQMILEEGRAEEARHFVVLLGTERFGPPDAAALTTLESIRDVARLEQLGRRLFTVTGWGELLAGL